VSVPDRD